MIRGRQLAAVALCSTVWLAAAPAALAQGVAGGGRLEISGGLIWTGHASLGSAAATETAPSGQFTLFSTSTDLTAAPGLEARIGVRVTPVFEVEASSSYARPQVETSVSGDVEGGAPVTAAESLRQFTIDGAAVVNVARWRIGRRATPFVLAGAGYLRELHEGDTLVAPGQTYFAGGGIKYLLASRPHRVKGVGVRADVRALMRRKGVAFDANLHTMPVVAASLFVRF